VIIQLKFITYFYFSKKRRGNCGDDGIEGLIGHAVDHAVGHAVGHANDNGSSTGSSVDDNGDGADILIRMVGSVGTDSSSNFDGTDADDGDGADADADDGDETDVDDGDDTDVDDGDDTDVDADADDGDDTDPVVCMVADADWMDGKAGRDK